MGHLAGYAPQRDNGEPAFHHLYGVSDWEYREQDLGLSAIFDAAMTSDSLETATWWWLARLLGERGR